MCAAKHYTTHKSQVITSGQKCHEALQRAKAAACSSWMRRNPGCRIIEYNKVGLVNEHSLKYAEWIWQGTRFLVQEPKMYHVETHGSMRGDTFVTRKTALTFKEDHIHNLRTRYKTFSISHGVCEETG